MNISQDGEIAKLKTENRKLRIAIRDPSINPVEYRALLDLLMCADPYPAPTGEAAIKEFADRKARYHGYNDWVEAYHFFIPATED